MTAASESMTKATSLDEEATAARHCVVLRKPGRAIVSLHQTLRPALPLGSAELARRIMRSPSILVDRVSASTAAGVASILTKIGAEVEVTSGEASSPPKDESRIECALIVDQTQNLPAIIKEVSILLQISLDAARAVVLRSPAVLLGNLGVAAAESLEEHFSELGARVISSDVRTARYDVYISASAAAIRRDFVQAAQRVGLPLHSQVADPQRPLCAEGLDGSQAEIINKELGSWNAYLRVINRDFYLFDLHFCKVASDADRGRLASWLSEQLGIPAKIAPELLQRPGIVLASDLAWERVAKHLEELETLGLKAEARLTTLTDFSLRVDAIDDHASALPILKYIAGLSHARTEAALRTLPAHFEGPFTRLQARWLQNALRASGARISLTASR